MPLFDSLSLDLPTVPPVTPAVTRQRQHTLRRSISCAGVGVHSGATIKMSLNPAPAGQGISFVRTDLKGAARHVGARWDTVTDTRLCTVIGNAQGTTIGTIEHLMAALRAMDIDNAVIEIDGPEVPIMDGSALPFMALIDEAGCALQKAERRWIEILRPVVIEAGDRRAALLPAETVHFHIEISFASSAIATQTYDLALSEARFRDEISAARTFGFYEEVDQLRKMGLARGGSLDNAVVIQGDRILNEGGLRFPDEFARHKLLDAVGDLALAGAPILGRFEGTRSGHAMNNQLLRALFADSTAWRLVTMPDREEVALPAARHRASA